MRRGRLWNIVEPGSFLKDSHRSEDRDPHPQVLRQFEHTTRLRMRAAKIAAQTTDGELHPDAMTKSEAVDDSSLGVADRKDEVLPHGNVGPAECEGRRGKGVDLGRRMVDMWAVTA